jgi:hypothetical protein
MWPRRFWRVTWLAASAGERRLLAVLDARAVKDPSEWRDAADYCGVAELDVPFAS